MAGDVVRERRRDGDQQAADGGEEDRAHLTMTSEGVSPRLTGSYTSLAGLAITRSAISRLSTSRRAVCSALGRSVRASVRNSSVTKPSRTPSVTVATAVAQAEHEALARPPALGQRERRRRRRSDRPSPRA